MALTVGGPGPPSYPLVNPDAAETPSESNCVNAALQTCRETHCPGRWFFIPVDTLIPCGY